VFIIRPLLSGYRFPQRLLDDAGKLALGGQRIPGMMQSKIPSKASAFKDNDQSRLGENAKWGAQRIEVPQTLSRQFVQGTLTSSIRAEYR
jgi:hypothetical protein